MDSVQFGISLLPIFQMEFKSGKYGDCNLTGAKFSFPVGFKQDTLNSVPSDTSKMTPTTVSELNRRLGSSSKLSIIQVSLKFIPEILNSNTIWALQPTAPSWTTALSGSALAEIRAYFTQLSEGDHGYHVGYSVQSIQEHVSLFVGCPLKVKLLVFYLCSSGPNFCQYLPEPFP
jgi:hypothetical protein